MNHNFLPFTIIKLCIKENIQKDIVCPKNTYIQILPKQGNRRTHFLPQINQAKNVGIYQDYSEQEKILDPYRIHMAKHWYLGYFWILAVVYIFSRHSFRKLGAFLQASNFRIIHVHNK